MAEIWQKVAKQARTECCQAQSKLIQNWMSRMRLKNLLGRKYFFGRQKSNLVGKTF